MWSPLEPGYVVAAMGGPPRDAARSDGAALDEWQRGQLLSVYSASRHLAAELRDVQPHVPGVAADLAAALRAAPPDVPTFSRLLGLAAELDGCHDPRALADVACRALDLLRADPSPGAREVRRALRATLKRAVELEVALLADAIEGPATG